MTNLLLGTDNGYVLRRTAADTIVVAYSSPAGHAFQSDVICFSGPDFNDTTKVTTMDNFGQLTKPLYSSDSGETWTLGTATLPAGGTKRAIGKAFNNYSMCIDNDGRVWITSFSFPTTTLYRATDTTALAYASVFVPGSVGGGNSYASRLTWIGDDHVWWIDTDTDSSNIALWRTDLAGGNAASWSTGIANPWAGNGAMNAWPGTNRLVAWRPASGPILSIDITDPDNPTWVLSSSTPFGAGIRVHDIYPLTNQIIVANGLVTVDDLSGSIWRSTDGGSTWTNVVANTTRLGSAADAGHAALDNFISAVAPDPKRPAEVWVAMCPPYLYHSVDSGATWSYETLDLSPCSTAPFEWTGICVAGLAGNPGIAVYHADAPGTQVSFTRT